MSKALLIDGSALMFKAYYATAYTGNLMKNSKGLHTNAIYGFANMMEKVLKMGYTHILVAFDKGKKTFRHEKLESYKDGRAAMPEEMREQIPYMKTYIELLGIKSYEMDLYEADDIIGSFARIYHDKFENIDILTGDKDLFQLVDNKVRVLMTRKGVSEMDIYDEKKLYEDYQITPDQMRDLKGLMGDSSDNYKGIPSVGEKTAIKLLVQYGTVENIIANMDQIPGKLGEKFREHYQNAIFCKEMATIVTDIDLPFNAADVEYSGALVDQLMDFYKEAEMNSFLKKMGNVSTPKKEVLALDYKILKSEIDIKDILTDKSYMHLEVFGDNYHKATPLGFAIVNEKGNFFIPFDLLYTSIDLQLFLTENKYKKSVFDSKKIKVVLKEQNFDIEGVSFDLLLAAYIINPKITKDEFRIVAQSFGYEEVMYDENIYGKGVKKAIPDLETYAVHAIKKAVAIKELEKQLVDSLLENNQYSLYEKVELPLASVLGEMESIGVKVDLNLLEEYKTDFSNRITNLEKEIHSLVGYEFNISSVKQLGEALFEKLELPCSKKTKTGYSTDADVLESLIDKHPVITKILDYRQLTKLYSTYVVGLESELIDGKAHTIYMQALTETGRLSSINPNLQNIPIRTEEGRLIRKLFVPSNDSKVFIGADYSQVELRILAHISKTKSLIEAFKNGEDIHSKTAQDVFGVTEVDSSLRRKAKAINFGIVYGISAYGLSEGVQISPQEAKMFIEKYLNTYPGIKQYMDNIIKFGQDNGYVETIYKRRRYIPELNSPVYMQREFGKRLCMNAPIQGSAADIIKIAMVKVDKALKDAKVKAKMILQVHDELIFEVDNKDQEVAMKIIKDAMENAVLLDVPLEVDANVGKTWYDLK